MNTAAKPRLADLMRGVANAIRMIECTVTDGMTAEHRPTMAEKRVILDQVRSLAHRLADLVLPGQDAIQLVDVGETIATIAGLPYCTTRSQINIHLNVCDNIPPLMCDPRDLEDVILNILDNTRSMMVGDGDIDLLVDREIRSFGNNFEEHYVRIQIKSGSNQNLCRIVYENSLAEQAQEKSHAPILELAREFSWQLGGSVTVDITAEDGMTVVLRLPARVARVGAVPAIIRQEPV